MPTKYIRKTNLTKTEWDAFNADLNMLLTNNSNLHQSDSSSFAQYISSCYHQMIEKHMPLREKKNDLLPIRVDKPWITPAIKNSITTKYKLLDKFKKIKKPIRQC